MSEQRINIARDFSKYPAGRFKSDGPFPGELCRERHFVPPLKRGDILIVELDGTKGYGSSFLEEAFGGLVRIDQFRSEDLKKLLKLVTTNSDLSEEIWEYIDEAEQQ